MINLSSILSFAASGFLIGLAAAQLGRKPKRPQVVLFLFFSLMLAAIEGIAGALGLARGPLEALGTLRMLLPLLIFFPAVGLPFFMTFGRRNDREMISGNIRAIVTLAVLLVAAAFILPPRLVVDRIHFTEGGSFWGVDVSAFGKGIGVYLLLVNVFLLFYFENTYRAATVPEKVTLKYPLLGTLAASVLNFVVMSRLVALSTIDVNFLAVESCGIIMFCTSFLFATIRYRLFDVRAYISREVASSVITIVVSGLYLLALALISYVAPALGLPFDRITIAVIGIFILFLLLAVLISGRARRRFRRFVNENFYLNRYDYRREWRRYAHLMASSASIDDLAANLISALCETLSARMGFVRIDFRSAVTASYGIPAEEIGESLPELIMGLSSGDPVTVSRRPLLEIPAAPARESQDEALGGGKPSGRDASERPSDGGSEPAPATGRWIRALAFIGAAAERRGFIALGERHMEMPYTHEDREFLAAVADQAALAIDNLIMEERSIEANQIEAFNRFASFVVHDLKNTVGMLSLTAENARENIHDIAFQRDTIETIRRSVEKMQRLIDSLNTRQSPTSIRRITIDVSTMIEQAIRTVGRAAESKHVSVASAFDRGILGEVDPTAIRRVIENIILNAIEASSEGGAVEVAACTRRDGVIEIRVTDTGPGFDPEYLRSDLFRPFRSTKRGGLGIGLVLCKTLIEAHGGSVSIGNRPGGGAAVTVLIPPAAEPA